MQKQTKFVAGALIVIISLGWLAWVGAKESKTYYHTIAELSTPKGAEARHRMRVGGTVRAGSIARYTGRVDFVIEGEGKSLPVSYTEATRCPIHLWITVRPWSREGWRRTAPSWPTKFRPSARQNMKRRRARRRKTTKTQGTRTKKAKP